MRLGSILTICAFVLTAVLVTSGSFWLPPSTTTASPKWFGSQRKVDLDDPFANLDAKEMARIFSLEAMKPPAGNWLVTAIPDKTQRGNSQVPVTVINTVSLMASGKLTNLVVAGVTVLNAARQPVKNITLKWSLIEVDKQATVARGTTVSFEVNIDSRRARKVRSPYINFVSLSRALIKEGRREGNFQLQIGVKTSQFADGSHGPMTSNLV